MQNISHTIPAYVFNGSNLSKLLRITKNTLKSSNFSPKVKVIFENNESKSKSSNFTEADRKSNKTTSHCVLKSFSV